MSSNTNRTSGQAASSPVVEVFMQMQKDKYEFFLNSQLRPTVEIPSDGFQKEWPIDSQRVQDLVISLYYEKTNERITTADRDYLMALIREECRHGKRSHSEDEAEETDKDVIVQAVLCHMNEHKTFDGRTIRLLKDLQEIQQSNQTSFEEFIPVFTNIFSRRLRRLIPVLRGYGIAVTLEHRDDGSYCTLKRLDSFQKEPVTDDAPNRQVELPMRARTYHRMTILTVKAGLIHQRPGRRPLSPRSQQSLTPLRKPKPHLIRREVRNERVPYSQTNSEMVPRLLG